MGEACLLDGIWMAQPLPQAIHRSLWKQIIGLTDVSFMRACWDAKCLQKTFRLLLCCHDSVISLFEFSILAWVHTILHKCTPFQTADTFFIPCKLSFRINKHRLDMLSYFVFWIWVSQLNFLILFGTGAILLLLLSKPLFFSVSAFSLSL